MSYDLEIWSVYPFQASALRHPEQWKRPESEQWVYEGRGWQIAIYASAKVVPEDISNQITELLPGIHYLTRLHLEGNQTSQSRQLLQATATEIGKATHGVISDEQEGTFKTPAGVKRFVVPEKEEEFSVLQMTWWFLKSPVTERSGQEAFLGLLERMLPEALPTRYGDHEPPQHKFAETGKEHLLRFIDTNLVWYPSRPVAFLHLDFPFSAGGSHVGFRTNRLQIGIEAAALRQPGWHDNLHLFWQEMSSSIDPIYGEVRTIGGYGRNRRGVFVKDWAMHQELNTDLTISWWWRGIPKRPGKALVLGKEYQRLWPKLALDAQIRNGLAFVSTDDWTNDEAMKHVVPDELAQPEMTKDDGTPLPMAGLKRYAAAWPFEDPYLNRRESVQ